MKRKAEMEEGSLFSQTDMTPKGSKDTKTAQPLRPAEEAAAHAWKEKIWEFDLTKPSQWMKDTMKEDMLKEGFGKREANKVFKGLFFKEKVCNTRTQALEYLKTIPTSYAVKYKIGITPSPKMVSLEKKAPGKRRKAVNLYKGTEREEIHRFLRILPPLQIQSEPQLHPSAPLSGVRQRHALRHCRQNHNHFGRNGQGLEKAL